MRCPSVFRVYWRTTHVTGSAIEAKAAFSAPRNLSAHDDCDDVDRAPVDEDGALLWNVAADLVADCGGRPNILPTIRIMDQLGRRQVYTWTLIHQLLGGLRHFAWDIGQGFDLPTANLMARATVIGSVILTVLVWTIGIWMRGAL